MRRLSTPRVIYTARDHDNDNQDLDGFSLQLSHNF
jgi:hypothetical protein